ncbi:tRNA pseudouridine(55) synthase TruB [Actinomyces bowdenii]|uniref:tRNA pseudouridine synthase B n=1 Tax=Actinomyces bowdenii TaxID=131109 RepID=A0A3P1V9D3_9ACTO|nr:tRNA pseudouridine(55) synthase TruB [Actinomyces bowdenii]RRD29985.1 tRNA pseudouridine(55) synthase TruB [Actinomyces bowdenii]
MSTTGQGGHGRARPRVARGAVGAADGLLLVDKPAGISSHDVVAAARRLAATRKVGHAGTLDPMATGLLVLGIGRATRLLTYLVGADKDYEATLRLGQETLTEDAEGEITAGAGCRPEDLPAALLSTALGSLTGEIMQVPSAVSAIKVGGVRSYARVRQGEAVELAARPVTVSSLDLRGQPRGATAADGTAVVDLDLGVSCSSGTYVRAIARDLGAALGCGAHLTALRRTRVGPFDVGEAKTLEALSAQVEADAASTRPGGLRVLGLSEAARRCFPAVELTEAEAGALGHGQALPASTLERAQAPAHPITPKSEASPGHQDSQEAAPGDAGPGPVVAGFAPDGAVVALLAARGSRARPVLVLAPA